MKINKKRIILLIVGILLILSYILLFSKILTGKKVQCTFTNKKENYKEVHNITLYYKKNKIYKMDTKEIFTSNIKEYIVVREKMYQNKDFKTSVTKNKVIASYHKKTDVEYQKTLEELMSTGYTCH